MEVLQFIFTYLFYIVTFSFCMYTVKYYSEAIRTKQARNEIANMQAKVATLRMALKARIKSKIRNYRQRFCKAETKGDALDGSLKTMTENKFETGQDFEDYIELSRKVNGLILIELKASSKYTEEERKMDFEDFMGPDFKNEIAIVRILKEITDTNEKLMEKIKEFNDLSKPKEKKMAMVPSLQFPSLVDVNRVFRDSSDVLKEQQQLDPDLFENVA